MKNFFVIILILFIAISPCPAQDPATTVNTNPQDQSNAQSAVSLWQTDEKFINLLNEEVVIDGFLLRPPKEYILSEIPGPEGAKLFSWKGQLREDQTYPYLMVSVVITPQEEKRDYSALEALDILLSGLERNRDDWNTSSVQEGQVNGLNFVRKYWTGTDRITGVKMKGFMYVMVEGKKIINLASQETLSNEDSLKLAEASALTFHRK